MPMITNARRVIAGTPREADDWLREVMGELGWDDPHRAYMALRATLHAIRDHLTAHEAAQLAAYLPLDIRSMWFEAWTPTETPLAITTPADFYATVKDELPSDGASSIPGVVRAVFTLLVAHLSLGGLPTRPASRQRQRHPSARQGDRPVRPRRAPRGWQTA